MTPPYTIYKDLCLVPVPTVAYEIGISRNHLSFRINKKESESIQLPGDWIIDGKWKFIADTASMTEEIAAGIVEKEYIDGEDEPYWYCYVPGGKVKANIFCDTALESFSTLLTSLNINMVNPEKYDIHNVKEWNQAQQTVTERVIILKRNGS